MRRRILVSSGIAATAVFVAILALPLQGQSRSTIGAGTPALVITAYNGGPALPYTVPRTPWGDPDLQGIWSSDDATMPVGARGGGGGRPGGPPSGVGAPGGPGEAVQRRCRRPPGDAPTALHDRRGVQDTSGDGRRKACRAAKSAERIVPRRLRAPGVPADVDDRRSAGRPAAAADAPRPRSAARHATRARSATGRSRASRTSRSTIAASPAASGARSCASSTATATASSRRRAWSRSATR